jgi:hypothetical protein
MTFHRAGIGLEFCQLKTTATRKWLCGKKIKMVGAWIRTSDFHRVKTNSNGNRMILKQLGDCQAFQVIASTTL